MPKSNVEFWEKKPYGIGNMTNITIELETMGCTAITVWECELKRKNVNRHLKPSIFK